MTSATSEDRAMDIRHHITIIDPRGDTSAGAGGSVTFLTSLAQKNVGIVTQGGWRSWEFFRERLEDHLSGLGQGVQYQRYQDDKPHPPTRYDEISHDMDVAVVGLGNCGSCTATVATAAAELASRGLPVVIVVTAGFRTLAEKTLEYRHQAQVPLVVLPAAYEVMTEEEIVRIALERVPDVAAALVERAAS